MAWRKGAEGERAVGRAIDKLASTRALHGRRIPGSRANINHILIAPTGVWTIDAKNYTGKLETRRRGRELWIKGRDRSKLLEQARCQTAIVTDVLATAGLATVPVRPALCLLGVEWPLLFTPRNAGDVDLLSPRHLSTLLVGTPVLSASQIDHVAVTLDRELRPAASPATPRSASSRTASSRPPGAIEPASRSRADARSCPGCDRQALEAIRQGPLVYVNSSDGTTLGYVDLQTNTVVAEERYRGMVRDAVARYLRET